jgi:hypothetical protein
VFGAMTIRAGCNEVFHAIVAAQASLVEVMHGDVKG